MHSGCRIARRRFGLQSAGVQGDDLLSIGIGRGGAAFVVKDDVRGGNVMVVREDEEPVLGDGAREEAFAFVDAANGIEIVAHDPGGVEVVVRGEEVAGEDGVLAA